MPDRQEPNASEIETDGSRPSQDVSVQASPDHGSATSDGQPDARQFPEEQDQQEYRAYLQRGDTRLSTLHRVAGAFLGGAGLLTLLPVLFRDTFSELFSQILFLQGNGFPATWSPERLLVLLPVVASLMLPVWSLYLLMGDLIRFYFTMHHFGSQAGTAYPRFILSGIFVSEDGLRDPKPLSTARQSPAVTELLVPKYVGIRRRLLREAHAVGGLRTVDETDLINDEKLADRELRKFSFEYTATIKRNLAEESAKMEASLARHLIRLRILVMRYAKAFLLTILTTGTTICALVVLNLAKPGLPVELGHRPGVTLVLGELIWVGLLAVYAAWGIAAAWLVRRPIIWIYGDLGNRNVLHRTPESLLLFERVTLIGVLVSSASVAAAIWLYAARSDEANVYWMAAASTLLFTIPSLAYIAWAFYENHRARAKRGIR
jgi:hypothetical protein